MSNNLPTIPKEGFFYRIKQFFIKNKKIKVNVEETSVEEQVTKEEKIDKPLSDIEKMRMQGKKARLKEEIIEIVDKNPELIRSLSDENLDELNKMYDEIIEENDRKIKDLERTLKSME